MDSHHADKFADHGQCEHRCLPSGIRCRNAAPRLCKIHLDLESNGIVGELQRQVSVLRGQLSDSESRMGRFLEKNDGVNARTMQLFDLWQHAKADLEMCDAERQVYSEELERRTADLMRSRALTDMLQRRLSDLEKENIFGTAEELGLDLSNSPGVTPEDIV